MKSKYTKEILEPVVKNCETWSDVSRYFNINPKGGSHTRLKNLVQSYGIDYSHFTGRASSYKDKTKGVTALEYINYEFVNSARLRTLLIKDGVKEEECERCKLTEWMGEKIPLDLDHIDGNNKNNTLDNLRILCKNCHGQTDTYGSKNYKKKRNCLLCSVELDGRGKYCRKCRIENASSIHIKK